MKKQKQKLPPITPGEILLKEFLKPMRLTQHRLALEIDVPYGVINEIVHGKRSLNAKVAIRLADYLGLSKRFWLNLQKRFDRVIEEEDAALIKAIKAGEHTKSISREEVFEILEGKSRGHFHI